MKIDSIKNGIVLDHITAGKSLEVYKALDQINQIVALLLLKTLNLIKWVKRYFKIDEEFALDFDVLGYLDPNITVCIIKDGKLVEKKNCNFLKIINVERCKNPRCITSTEQGLDHVFYLANEEKRIYRCLYCETKVEKNRSFASISMLEQLQRQSN